MTGPAAVRMPFDQRVLAWHSYLTQRVRDGSANGRALAALLEDHRVLRLVWYHRPVCRACWYAADQQHPVEHPCPTVETISGALGVPLPVDDVPVR